MRELLLMKYIHCQNVLLVILLETETFLFSNPRSSIFMVPLKLCRG